MSKYDPKKAQSLVTTVQQDIEKQMAEDFRQAQMRRYERIFFAGYQQAERDYQVGAFSPKNVPGENK